MTKRKSKGASVVKIGAIYTLSNLVVRGIAFLTTPLFTRLMSQTEYGDFSNIASWANIISVVITLSLYSSINRAKYDYDEEIYSYMSSIILLGSFVTLICWGIIELNMPWFERFFSMDRMYIRGLLLFCVFSPAVQTLMAKFRMYGEYRGVIFLTWLTLLTSTFFSLLLVVIMPDKLQGRVWGNYIIVAFADLVVWIYIVVRGRRFSVNHCKYALILALPLIPHELAGILLTSSDRIIIKQICGSNDAALYSLAYTIATIITVLLSSLNQAWVPWFYDRLNDKNHKVIKSASKWYVLLFTAGCFGLMLIGPELVLIFGGKSYMEAAYVIPPVCFAIELQFIYTLYVNVEFYVKKTITISIATIMATAVNILLNYLMIPQLGYMAAAYTTVIGYFLMVVFHFLVVNRYKEYKGIFHFKMIIICMGLSLIAMGISLALYQSNIIRLIVLAVYLLILVGFGFMKRRELVILFANRKET